MNRRKFLGFFSVGAAVVVVPKMVSESLPGELSLSIDEFSDRYIEPAVEEMLRRDAKLTRLDEITRQSLLILKDKILNV